MGEKLKASLGSSTGWVVMEDQSQTNNKKELAPTRWREQLGLRESKSADPSAACSVLGMVAAGFSWDFIYPMLRASALDKHLGCLS